MNLYRLKSRPALQPESKAFKKQEKLNTLLAELETRNLPESLSNTENKCRDPEADPSAPASPPYHPSLEIVVPFNIFNLKYLAIKIASAIP